MRGRRRFITTLLAGVLGQPRAPSLEPRNLTPDPWPLFDGYNRRHFRRSHMMNRLLPVTVAVGALLLATPALAAPNCEALTGLKLTDTTITEARSNTTGAFTPPGARSRPLDKLPAFCAVKGVLKPTPTSAIQFEVWSPET